MSAEKSSLESRFASAEAYDRRIRRLVPYYPELMDSLLAGIPLLEPPVEILELGCGTGTFTLRILETGACARLTALDIVPEMVESAKSRLARYAGTVNLIEADFVEYDHPEAYDVVLSNLALHYPETDESKLQTCRNVLRTLRPGGAFCFSVMLAGESEAATKALWRAWERDVIRHGVPRQEIEEWYRTHHATDYPVAPDLWLRWLRQVGFVDGELVFRRTVFGSFWARKP